jgi:hypothetical protein
VNKGIRIIFRNYEETLIGGRRDASIGGYRDELHNRKCVKSAVDHEVSSHALLDVIDYRELRGQRPTGKAESSRVIADAIATANDGLVA